MKLKWARWTPDEDAVLRRDHKKGPAYIQKSLSGRSRHQIAGRCARLGLTLPKRKSPTPTQQRKLKVIGHAWRNSLEAHAAREMLATPDPDPLPPMQPLRWEPGLSSRPGALDYRQIPSLIGTAGH